MIDLVKRLDIKAGVMEMGEQIAWGSDTALMREAARRIEAFEKREALLVSLTGTLWPQNETTEKLAEILGVET